MVHIKKDNTNKYYCASCNEITNTSYLIELTKQSTNIPLCKECYERLKTEIEFLDFDDKDQ